jgi:DNA-binding NarL/FixJ family response regulator
MAVASLIRLLLVDDHVLVRQGVRDLLCSYPNIQVVGEAGDGEEGLQQVQKLQPSVVVMDITMPKMDGITSTRFIKTHYPNVLVIGLSVLVQSYHRDAMIKAGACEVITKEKAVDELYGAIEHAVAAFQRGLIHEEIPASVKPSGSITSLAEKITRICVRKLADKTVC